MQAESAANRSLGGPPKRRFTTWNASRAKRVQQKYGVRNPNINCFIEFLNARCVHDGPTPVAVQLDAPVEQADWWWRFPVSSFDEKSLPTRPSGGWEAKADWQRAWHGTQLEALRSQLYHGRLAASFDKSSGHQSTGGRALCTMTQRNDFLFRRPAVFLQGRTILDVWPAPS